MQQLIFQHGIEVFRDHHTEPVPMNEFIKIRESSCKFSHIVMDFHEFQKIIINRRFYEFSQFPRGR